MATTMSNVGEGKSSGEWEWKKLGGSMALPALPADLFEADSYMAVRTLLKTLSIIALGYALYGTPYLVPLGVLLVGCGMTYMYMVGYECSQLTFFKSKYANLITRFFAWGPLLTSVEGDRVGYWLARLVPFVTVLALCAYFGVLRFMELFAKYWLLPLCVMHFNLMQDSDHRKQYNRVMRSLFPELSSNARIEEMLGRVPFYKLDAALHALGSGVCTESWTSDGILALAAMPSRYVASEILFWRKRDLLVELALLSAAVLAPLCYLEHVPALALGLPAGLLLCGFARASELSRDLNRSLSGLISHAAAGLCSTWGTKVPHWFNIIYLGSCHVLGLLAVFLALPVAQWKTLFFGIPLTYFVGGMGITVGAHRLWSHKSFEAAWPLRLFLAFGAYVANQGSLWHWCRDHRVHHRYSDTGRDPHNANYGFWYSHFGWLMVQKEPQVVQAGREMDLSDLEADPIFMWQKKLYPFGGPFCCFILPALVPWYFWNESFLVGVGIAFFRYVLVLNATWCVNSVAHCFGYRPYRPNAPPAENLFVSILAVGEGWHSYHHAYAFDYATSEFGVLGQWNPSKFFIDTMALFGLAWNRKRATHLAVKARERNGFLTADEKTAAVKTH